MKITLIRQTQCYKFPQKLEQIEDTLNVQVSANSIIQKAVEVCSKNSFYGTFTINGDSNTIAWIIIDDFVGYGVQQVQTLSITPADAELVATFNIANGFYYKSNPEHVRIYKITGNSPKLTITSQLGMEWNNGINGYVYFALDIKVYKISS